MVYKVVMCLGYRFHNAECKATLADSSWVAGGTLEFNTYIVPKPDLMQTLLCHAMWVSAVELTQVNRGRAHSSWEGGRHNQEGVWPMADVGWSRLAATWYRSEQILQLLEERLVPSVISVPPPVYRSLEYSPFPALTLERAH